MHGMPAWTLRHSIAIVREGERVGEMKGEATEWSFVSTAEDEERGNVVVRGRRKVLE